MSSQDNRIPVAILGATGSVGQRFIQLLADHPWFRIAELTASERSAGKTYAEAADWYQSTTLPASVADQVVKATDPTAEPLTSPILFSALDSATAKAVEALYARAGHFVVSNASAHRMDADVPLMVPEVNPEHLGLLAGQDYGTGGLLTNPNCSTIGLVSALKPLHDAFGLEAVQVTTLQAVSGAGIPGVSSMAMIDNIVPFIGNEEDKLETEPQKILGALTDGAVKPGRFVVSATCNRVPVVDGHTLCVSVRLDTMADLDQVADALRGFTSEAQTLGLPSAPKQPIHLLDAPDRPQPRLDRDRDGGMATTVGRLRKCPILDYKFTILSHNTVRGAAGGSILVAELALAKGVLGDLRVPA